MKRLITLVFISLILSSNILMASPDIIANPNIDNMKSQRLPDKIIAQYINKRFIVGHNLKRGAAVYADRNFTYWDIPSELEGSDYFITYNKDKFQKGNDFIRFKHPDDLIVYVAFDNRLKAPSWLRRNGFIKINESIDIFIPDNKTHLKYGLYKKKYPAGDIVLGGNLHENENFNGAMYLVIFSEDSNIAKPLPTDFVYIGNSAYDDDHHGDFDELQGITNGDPNVDPYWFFSRNEGIFTILYRVGYQHHLKNDFPCYVHHVRLPDDKPPFFSMCKHVGDIKYLQDPRTKKGYIFAAYDNCQKNRAYIAVFRASDIKNISGNTIKPHGMLDIANVQRKEAYVVSAQHMEGSDDRVYLYSGAGKLPGTKDKIYEYEVKWKDIVSGGTISMQSWKSHKLMYPSGKPFIVENWQGIDFSEDGRLLFMSVGDGSGDEAKKRIHVLKRQNMTSWSLYFSSDYGKNGGPFLFESNREEEPEGLSWFDMNNVPNYHPGMPRGELHVILLNNDAGKDNVYIKHYISNP